MNGEMLQLGRKIIPVASYDEHWRVLCPPEMTI
jgi:hypothetical protein